MLFYSIVASTAVATYSSYQQTKAANEAADYNAEVSNRNAAVAEMQAVDAEQRGAIEEKQLRLSIAKTQGQQNSALAGSGVVVGEGSALDVLEDTAYLGELDAMTLKHNTEMEAWGYRNQGANYKAQSGLSLLSKKNAGVAAGTTLLTSASEGYQRYYTAKGTKGTKGGETE